MASDPRRFTANAATSSTVWPFSTLMYLSFLLRGPVISPRIVRNRPPLIPLAWNDVLRALTD